MGVGLVKRSMDIRVGRLELWPDPPVLGRISHLIRFVFLSFMQALLMTHMFSYSNLLGHSLGDYIQHVDRSLPRMVPRFWQSILAIPCKYELP